VAEQFSDFVERSAFPEQACGNGMAEQVGSSPARIDSHAYQRLADNRGNHPSGCEALQGSYIAEEDPAASGAWPAGAEIVRDGFADIGWEWQLR
jgi:hypothetical protein